MQGLSLSEAVFTEEENDVGIDDIDVDCNGLRREEWLNIPVMLVNETGQNVAKVPKNDPLKLSQYTLPNAILDYLTSYFQITTPISHQQ